MSSIRDDLKSFKRTWVHHTGMQLATLSVLTATFSVVTFFLASSLNLKRVLTSWGDDIQMTAYLKETVSDERAKELSVSLRENKAIKAVVYIPKETATKNFKLQMASYAPDLLADAQFANPFPASFRLSITGGVNSEADVQRLESIAGEIQQIPGVEDVSFGQGWVKNYSSFISAIYAGSSVMAIILVLGSLLVIGNAIRAAFSSRREEIEIMELVGATSAMIRRPFLFEGLMLGGMASALSLLFNYFLFTWEKSVLSSSFALARLVPLLSYFNLTWLLGFIVLGASLGTIGAWLTVRGINDGWSAKQGLET